MSHPSTAREALIAEAIGDVAQLLDRVEALMQGMEGARQEQAAAAIELGRQLGAVDSSVATITDGAKTRAMSDAARSLFDEEVGATLQRLCVSLQRLIERADRPWEHGATHAATALVASAVAWGLACYLYR